MQRLMLVSEYRETYFTEGSRPSVNTIKRWIREGELPGKRMGSLYYVLIDQEVHATGSKLADAVLASFEV